MSSTQGTGYEASIYAQRFDSSQEAVRLASWRVLGQDFFPKFVAHTDTVVDVGAGDGLLLRNLRAHRRIAVDINPCANLSDLHIESLQCLATEFASRLDQAVDVVVMSNFLEHLPTRQLVIEVFREARRALTPTGKLLILQPNIRYVGAAYWDYIDHHIALTEHSLQEALGVAGFRVQTMIPRFLPYTVKSRLGRIASSLDPGLLMKVYLRFPILWRFLGGQTFVEAVPA
jgi:SAM-dependent methyltransferase